MEYQFKINHNKIIKINSYILINKAFNSDSILISLYTPPRLHEIFDLYNLIINNDQPIPCTPSLYKIQ